MPIIGRLTDTEKQKLEKVRLKIIADFPAHHTIEWLSTYSGLNELILKQGFKKQYGTTVYGYLEDLRLQLGMQLVINSYESSQSIAQKCGYTLSTNFAATFRRKFGCTPKKYRMQAGLAIQESEGKSTAMVNKAISIINTLLQKHHTSQSLANIIGVDPNKLCAAFKNKFGMGVYLYLRLKRMEKVKELTRKGQSANEIYPLIGYKNVTGLYTAFKLTYKQTFGTWKEEMEKSELVNDTLSIQRNDAIQYDFLVP